MAAETMELPDGQEQFKLNEVCKLANVQPYMLRFWGSEFPELEAASSGTGQRSYTRQQVELIFEIRHMLFDEGLTIAGTRKRLNAGSDGEAKPKKSTKKKRPAGATAEPPASSDDDGASVHQEAVESQHAPADDEASEVLVSSRQASGSSVMSQEEVDKIASERVKPLLATLTELRSEIADILRQLRPQHEE